MIDKIFIKGKLDDRSVAASYGPSKDQLGNGLIKGFLETNFKKNW